MHLLPAMYSTTGKKSGPKKWASAEAKRKAEQLQAQWQTKLGTWGVKDAKKITLKSSTSKLSNKVYTPPGRETPRIESQDTGWVACTKSADKVYTGNAVVGIAVQHKSCLQPVFNKEAAKDSASMRR